MDPSSFHAHHTGRYITILVLIILISGLIYWGNMNGYLKGMFSPQAAIDPVQLEKAKFVNQVYQQGVDTTTINVTDCLASPSVARFPLNSTVTFKNADEKPHDITFSPVLKFTVPAKSEFQFNFDTWKFPGVRRFDCDELLQAGTVFVTQ